MARTESVMLDLGASAVDFSIPDFDGKPVSLLDISSGRPFVVMFVSNHCPFVKHIADELGKFGDWCIQNNIGIVAINSNDVENYPDDSIENMKTFATERSWRFPYLFDHSQQTAKDYYAACTPDFYFFDSQKELVYRGRFDPSTPGNGFAVTGEELRNAVKLFIEKGQTAGVQKPSIGCNIKWRSGNEPEYFGGKVL